MKTISFDFKKALVNKKNADGKSIYTAIASTAALDRDYEILIPKGVITDNFLKNPVILFVHDKRSIPIGKVIEIYVTEEAVKMDFVFNADDELASKVEKAYVNGFMNAFSVGFRPKSYVYVDDLPMEVNSVDVNLPDGSTYTVDFSKYSERPWGIIPKWELHELSAVPVPTNPEALLERAKEAMIYKSVMGDHNTHLTGIMTDRLTSQFNEIKGILNAFTKQLETEQPVSNVVPYEASKTVSEDAFDELKELGYLAVHVSSDKTGDKQTISWNKYVKAFAHFNAKEVDRFSSYELLHHVVKEDELVLSKPALFKAMGDLLSKSETLKLFSDFSKNEEEVYQHLASHYSELGLTAPEYSKEYTEDQIKEIRKVGLLSLEIKEQESDTVLDSVTPLEAPTKEISALRGDVNELTAELKIKFQVMYNLMADLACSVSELKSVSKQEEPDPSESESDESAHPALSKMISDIGELLKLS